MSISSGKVCDRLVIVTVTLVTALGRPDTLMVDGYGEAALASTMVMPALLAGLVLAPTANWKLTVPRSVAPSCNCNVAVTVEPHVALAVNVNGCATAAPPAVTSPYVCGPLGAVTLPEDCKVATRFTALLAPMFFSAKFTVTVSSGSMRLLAGPQLSAVIVALSATRMRMGINEKFCVVVPPLETLTPLFVALAYPNAEAIML